MTKQLARELVSPAVITPGGLIRAADAQLVARAHGYAVGEVTESLMNWRGYTREDSGLVEPVLFLGPGTNLIDAVIWVPAHAQDVFVDVEMEIANGTGEVIATINGVAFTFQRLAGNPQPAFQRWTPGAVSGPVSVTVTGELISGVDPEAALRAVRIETEAIPAASIPDPPV